MKKIAILLMCSLFVLGCSKNTNNADSKKESADEKVIQIVKSQLKDPDSAKFQNIKGQCGEINAKNSFGGYVGFKRFLIQPNGDVVIEDQDPNLAFNPLWDKLCNS